MGHRGDLWATEVGLGRTPQRKSCSYRSLFKKEIFKKRQLEAVTGAFGRVGDRSGGEEAGVVADVDDQPLPAGDEQEDLPARELAQLWTAPECRGRGLPGCN